MKFRLEGAERSSAVRSLLFWVDAEKDFFHTPVANPVYKARGSDLYPFGQ